MADVFISYSRRDQDLVRRLGESLEARGKDVWVDLNDIIPSAPWMAEIRVAIAEADSVVFVISPDSVASEVCRAELGHAVELNKHLVPLVARPTPVSDVPAPLAALNFLDLSDEDDARFQAGLDRLIAAIDTDLEAVHLHTRLLLRALEWDDSSQDPARLLRGRQLAEAERWLSAGTGRGPAPTPAQVRLVLTSRRAAVRRQRGTVAAALSVALGMVALALVAVLQWHAAVVQRGQADSRADAAEAENDLRADPPLALDLALRGIQESPTDEAQTALRDAVQASVLRAVLAPMKQAELAASRSADGSGGQGDLAMAPSGSYVAVANTSGGVEVWRWQAKTGAGSYQHPYRAVVPGAQQAEFTSAGQELLVTDDNGDLLGWRWQTGAKPVVLRRHLGNAVLSLDGAYLASFSSSPSSETVVTMQTGTGRMVSVVRTGPVLGVALSPDGSLLATWDADGSGPVKLWATSDGRFVEALGTTPELLANTGELPVAISPGDDRVAVAGTNEISVYTVAAPRQAPKVLEMSAPPGAFADAGGTYTAGSLAWSPSGQALAEGGYDEAVRVWSGDLGGQTFLGPVGNGAGGVVFSPDGRYLASADGEGMARVWAWAADTEDHLAAGGFINAAAISPSGNVAAYSAATSASLALISLWDWRDFRLQPLTVVNSFAGVSLTFSPNGEWLAVSSENNLSVWDVATRRRLASISLPGYGADAGDLCFDPSGRALAALETTVSHNLGQGPATLLSWRWGSGRGPGRLPGLVQTANGDIGIARVGTDGSVRFVDNRNFMAWGGSSSGRATVVARDVAPALGGPTEAAFLHNGTEMLEEVGTAGHEQAEMVDLTDGSHRAVFPQFTMQGIFTASPGGTLVAGTAQNGDEVVWDEVASDTPVTIPTADPGSDVALSAANVVLIAEGTYLYVVPASYCQPLAKVVSLAKSLLVQPTGLAEQGSYND